MSKPAEPTAHLVLDLGFGDAGKGLIVDHLVRATGAGLVVRFNGGAQCGHNVVTPEGHHHTFAQLGAGSFVPGARTLLGPCVVVHPTGLWEEARAFARLGIGAPLRRVSISARARIVTPYHQAANRLRELARGAARHGSCGIGIGETVADCAAHPDASLLAGDLGNPARLAARLAEIGERLRTSLGAAWEADDAAAEAERALFGNDSWTASWVDRVGALAREITVVDDGRVVDMIADADQVVFEGAQGVLLDENHGFHPHTTWSDCTFAHALELCAQASERHRVVRLGLLRTHAVRHGAGPLPTESHGDARPRSDHNTTGPWQGPVRYGCFDAVLARHALAVVGGVDALAITHVDAAHAHPHWSFARAWTGALPESRVLRNADGEITDLLPASTPDLEEQALISRGLSAVQPVLAHMPPERMLPTIEQLTRTPVHMFSDGPTHLHVHTRR